jgi:hypothetical protein
MEGMSKSVLAGAAIAWAMVLACMAVVLTAVPGVGKPRTVTLVGAGDIAGCDFNQDRKTARLLGKIAGTVFILGDSAYPEGTRKQFRECYDPTWGKYKKRTRAPVIEVDHRPVATVFKEALRIRSGHRAQCLAYDLHECLLAASARRS